MTGSRYDNLTDDEIQWLEEVKAPERPKTPPHSCGNCKTPFGRSAIQCVNDPAYDPLKRIRDALGA